MLVERSPASLGKHFLRNASPKKTLFLENLIISASYYVLKNLARNVLKKENNYCCQAGHRSREEVMEGTSLKSDQTADPANAQFAVLVVENDQGQLRVMRTVLEAQGGTCFVAEDIASAHKMIGSAPFYLVLLNVELPDGNGLDLIPALRDAHSETPIISLTSHNTREIELLARKERVVYHLIKPIDADELGSAVAHIKAKKQR